MTGFFEDKDGDPRIFRIVGVVFILILGFFAVFNSFFVVSSGETAVVYSAISGTKPGVYSEGAHLKTPFIESVTDYEVRTRLYSANAGAASKDLQVVTTQIGLNYHLTKESVSVVHRSIGPAYEERIIVPSVQEVVKSVTANYIAEDLITHREQAKQQIKTELSARLLASNIYVDEVSITDFDFSPEFNKAIEEKVQAEQNALKEQNNLKVVEFQAQQKVAQAKGEAEAIGIINAQLEKSPQMVPYLAVQKWNGVAPQAVGTDTIFSIGGK